MKNRHSLFAAVVALLMVLSSCNEAPNESNTISPLTLRFSQPVSEAEAVCKLTDLGGSIHVEGESIGLSERGMRLLLYVDPQHPAANGWILQQGKDSLPALRSDGTWEGGVQLGNKEYPPRGDEVISIAVIAVDEEAKEKIQKETAPGQPQKSLPQVPSNQQDIARDVRVKVLP